MSGLSLKNLEMLSRVKVVQSKHPRSLDSGLETGITIDTTVLATFEILRSELDTLNYINVIRVHLLELGVGCYLFFCGCYDVLFGKNHYFIFLYIQAIAFFIMAFGYVGTFVPNSQKAFLPVSVALILSAFVIYWCFQQAITGCQYKTQGDRFSGLCISRVSDSDSENFIFFFFYCEYSAKIRRLQNKFFCHGID